jgi:hypothetical protein
MKVQILNLNELENYSKTNRDKVRISYKCTESEQASIISSGGNYTTIIEVNFIDQLKAEFLIKKNYFELITLLVKRLINQEEC